MRTAQVDLERNEVSFFQFSRFKEFYFGGKDIFRDSKDQAKEA